MDPPSLWWTKSGRDTSPHVTHALPASAEVVVVGGGVTGMATAYAALSGGASSVVVVEAGRVASGASGRNGGQLWPSFRVPHDIVSPDELPDNLVAAFDFDYACLRDIADFAARTVGAEAIGLELGGGLGVEIIPDPLC